MFREDWLLRQVRQLAQFVARVLGRRDQEALAELEAACARAGGLDLDVAEQLPPASLLPLLTTADGLDAERCLALGLGLCARALVARDASPARFTRLRTSGATLVATALAARPSLDDPAIQQLLAELAAEA